MELLAAVRLLHALVLLPAVLDTSLPWDTCRAHGFLTVWGTSWKHLARYLRPDA